MPDRKKKYKAVCKNLKTFREENGLTQQQVAEILGVDRSTYAYYEAGKTTPGFDVIDKLLKLFNINYTDLFSKQESYASVRDSGLDSLDGLSYMGAVSKEERALIVKFRLLSGAQRRGLLESLSIIEKDEQEADEYEED